MVNYLYPDSTEWLIQVSFYFMIVFTRDFFRTVLVNFKDQIMYPLSSISGCFENWFLTYSISLPSTSLLQMGHLLHSGIEWQITSPYESFSFALSINQSRWTQMRWNRWKHWSILTKSTLSEKLDSSDLPSWQNCSRHTAHLPSTVSLYDVRISRIFSCRS